MKTWFIPTVMVRNEEYHIAQVLRPLVAICGHVMLGDTGSTDNTIAIAKQIDGVEVIEYGQQSQIGLTETRRNLGMRVKEKGVDWQLLCDGDELYNITTLQHIAAEGMPDGKLTGFTKMVTVDRDPDNSLWEMNDKFARAAILPSDTVWHGIYPFDVPDCYRYDNKYHYFTLPQGYEYHAVHLHRLTRSPHDEDVVLRLTKQKQFAMRDVIVPRTIIFDMDWWCRQ